MSVNPGADDGGLVGSSYIRYKLGDTFILVLVWDSSTVYGAIPIQWTLRRRGIVFTFAC